MHNIITTERRSPIDTTIVKEKSTFNLNSIIAGIIEAIKRLVKGPDQAYMEKKAIEIFTAKPPAGIPWHDELEKRKNAVVELYKTFNRKNPKNQFSDLIINNIKTLAPFTYAEICQTPRYAIDRYGYHATRSRD